MRANVIRANVAGGELSPSVRGRSDTEIFFRGAERLENFIPEIQGAARYRNGFRFVNNTRRNNVARLIEFQFNDLQAYILEFTDSYMRVYKDGGVVLVSASVKNIIGATQADPVVITSTGHGLADGETVFIEDVSGMVEINNKYFVVANKTANTFELTNEEGVDIDGTGYTAYVSGGTVTKIFELSIPYAEADLFEIDFDQNADTMYIVHPSYDVRKLTRTADDVWTIGTFARTNDPFTGADKFPSTVAFYQGRLGYGRTNDDPDKIWLSRGPLDTGVPRYDDFTTGSDADHAVFSTIPPTLGEVESVQWISGTRDFLAIGTLAGISRMDSGTQGEPLAADAIRVIPLDPYGAASIKPVKAGNIVFYVQRGKRVLRSLEYSLLADNYRTFDQTLAADHILLGGVKQLTFVRNRPDMVLAVLGDGSLRGMIYRQTEEVAAWFRIKIGGLNVSTLSVATLPQEDGFEQGWVVNERTINGVVKRYVEFLEDPIEFLDPIDFYTGEREADNDKWQNAVFEQGKESFHLDSFLTYDGSDAGDIGGTMTPGAVTGTGITFTAASPIFLSSDVGRQIWKKYDSEGVGGGRAEIKTYVSPTQVTCNILSDFNNVDVIQVGDWFLTTDEVGGLDHLEGETVGVQVDGAPRPDTEVTNGIAIVDKQGSIIHIGEKMTGIYKTMNIEVGGSSGPAQSKNRNVFRIGIRFLNTIGAKYGSDIYKMEAIPLTNFTELGQKTGRPAPLYSDFKRLSFKTDSWQNDSKRNKEVIIIQDKPAPCTVQALDIYGETNE